MASEPARTTSERELVVERSFDALPEAVFDAWLDSEGLGKWLFATPDGETVRVDVDPHVGGTFRIIEKRGDELADHFGEYLEIDRPKQLVFSFSTDREQKPTFVKVEIEPLAAGSKLTLTHRIGDEWAEYFDRTREGWTTILNALGEALSELTLVIKREFDAPRELVFAAWTEPERIAQWLGPRGYTTYECSMDARVGGAWHFRMRSVDAEHGSGGVIRELSEPERLVFTFAWDGEHPTNSGREMLIAIDFAERGGKTEMTFRQTIFESIEDRDGHNTGWSESFDKLEEYLQSL